MASYYPGSFQHLLAGVLIVIGILFSLIATFGNDKFMCNVGTCRSDVKGEIQVEDPQE